MIPWKNPEVELPEVGAAVWVLEQHSTKNGVLSCTIHGARVRVVKTEHADFISAENEDESGAGWLTFILQDKIAKEKQGSSWRPDAIAWCYADELATPTWMENRRAR